MPCLSQSVHKYVYYLWELNAFDKTSTATGISTLVKNEAQTEEVNLNGKSDRRYLV